MTNETPQPTLVDVRDLIKRSSLEELCGSAEGFFAQRAEWDSLMAKPLAEIDEAPELLISFAHVVRGLHLLPDMTILDFGAGSCWTSRFLTQLGLKVIALDVSKSALQMGRKLYRRQRIVGHKPRPEFLLFNGRRINLPDASVDRISCWESFHHVPNPHEVIHEMARVLKPGGIAGFSEPGPEHSKSEQSQLEMRTNRVIENDVNVHEIWESAQEAGFTKITLSIFNPEPTLVSLDEFDQFIAGTSTPDGHIADLRRQMQERRLFFLFKGESKAQVDSRRREGLRAALKVTASSNRVAAGKSIRLQIAVKNTGAAIWLPTPDVPLPWWKIGPLVRMGKRRYMGPDVVPPRVGGVRFAIQLLDDHGKLLDIDYFRYHLTPGEGRPIQPGEAVAFEIKVPMPRTGKYLLDCRLVSEQVYWFDNNDATVRIPVEVN